MLWEKMGKMVERQELGVLCPWELPGFLNGGLAVKEKFQPVCLD